MTSRFGRRRREVERRREPVRRRIVRRGSRGQSLARPGVVWSPHYSLRCSTAPAAPGGLHAVLRLNEQRTRKPAANTGVSSHELEPRAAPK